MVARAVNFTLNDYTVRAVMAVDKKSQQGGDEEEDAVPGDC
jgi:hypothetical protein